MSHQNQSMSMLIWAKVNRLQQGKAPLFLRITINGKRVEISTQRNISLIEWNPQSQTVTGKSAQAREINNHLAVLKSKVLACYSKLELRDKNVTAEMVKIELLGIAEKPRSLMQIIREHNREVKSLIGKGYAKGTWLKYNTMEKHVAEFLQWKYKRKDFNLKDLR
ncbi:MAG: Arm DNA-binding domain-containing protein, partial [Chitinophagaceae bacterium]